MFNAEAAYFCVALYYGLTPGMKGEDDVMFADVEAGNMVVTTMVALGKVLAFVQK